MDDETTRIAIADRHAASVTAALRLTRSEDSSGDEVVDGFGRWVNASRRRSTRPAPGMESEDPQLLA